MRSALLQSVLSFAGPAIIALLLFLLGLTLQNSNRDLAGAIQDSSARLDRMSQVIVRADALGTSDTSLAETRKTLLRTGATSEIVGTELLAIAQQMAGELGLPLGRFSIAGAEAKTGFEAVAVTLELSGVVTQVYGMIEKLEGVRPPLAIKRLRLQSMSPPGTETDADTILMIEVTLEAPIQLPAKATLE